MVIFIFRRVVILGVMVSIEYYVCFNKGKFIWFWGRIIIVIYCFMVFEYIYISKGMCFIFYFWRW